MQDYQKTSLRDVTVQIVVGLHAWEYARGRKQKITVDVDLYRHKGKFTGKSIDDCLDYDRPFRYITEKWPKRAHTELLETLAEDLVEFCLKDKKVDAVRVVISKPDVYKGHACPQVEFFRTRSKGRGK